MYRLQKFSRLGSLPRARPLHPNPSMATNNDVGHNSAHTTPMTLGPCHCLPLPTQTFLLQNHNTTVNAHIKSATRALPPRMALCPHRMSICTNAKPAGLSQTQTHRLHLPINVVNILTTQHHGTPRLPRNCWLCRLFTACRLLNPCPKG